MPYALIVEDDVGSRSALSELVKQEGFEVRVTASSEEARALVQESEPDLVLLDLVLPDGSGMGILEQLQADSANTEVIVLTGHASVDTAVDAMRLGAADYLTKPLDMQRLRAVLTNIARTRELKEEIDSLRSELRKLGRFGAMVGTCPTMEDVYDLITKVAPTEATVLITGESGTGKDLAAQAIHQLSRRRNGPYLPLNCGAVSPSLIESELFGHEKGSFTSADRTHKGYFERASGGTLFLDEISEMPIELQVKLLRVLETAMITRIGGEESIAVDVRVIAATNQNPEEVVQAGRMREDLLYRLNVFPISLPPLRERGDDIVLLSNHFLDELNRDQGGNKRWSRSTLEHMRGYEWPGNVRELRNVVHRAFILANEEIDPGCLPEEVRGTALAPNDNGAEPFGPVLRLRVGESIADAERRLIMATLDHFGGDKQRTAGILGISVKTLYNRLHAYDDGRKTSA